MLEKCKDAKERWGGVHELIDRWLNERRALIVHMFEINAGNGLAAEREPLELRIQNFCEILVDYVSAGHFEVYEQLVREAQEFADDNLEQTQAVFARLDANTETVLAFNDNYRDAGETVRHLNELEVDLSRLGERLEERFELEDRLIQDLHEVHRDKVLSEE
ncbi:MAG: sigma D regulator [Natronospirillum sp.]